MWFISSPLSTRLALSVLALTGLQTASAQTIERVKLTDNDLSCQQIYAESQQMDTAMQLAGPGLPASLAAAPPAAATVPQGAPLSAVQQAVLNHPNNANLTPEQKATLIAQTGLAESRGNAAVAGLYAGAPTAGALQGAVAMDPGVQAAVARARASGMSEAQINATMGLGMQRAGLGAAAAPLAGQALAQGGGLGGIFGALAGAVAPRAAPPAMPVAAAAPPQGTGLGAQAKARKDHLTGLFLSRGCRMSDLQK